MMMMMIALIHYRDDTITPGVSDQHFRGDSIGGTQDYRMI